MHVTAEEGVAAHWKYKEGKRGGHDDDEALKVLRSLVEWTQDAKRFARVHRRAQARIFIQGLYAFTPMGKVIQLPRGATTVDFAYMIHSESATTAPGRAFNGRMVPLRNLDSKRRCSRDYPHHQRASFA